MKPYLLIMGYSYYPSAGTGDWIDTFETYESAKSAVMRSEHEKGYILTSEHAEQKPYQVTYDWFEIVNLLEWINK